MKVNRFRVQGSGLGNIKHKASMGYLFNAFIAPLHPLGCAGYYGSRSIWCVDSIVLTLNPEP
jgi:hypothetical protein